MLVATRIAAAALALALVSVPAQAQAPPAEKPVCGRDLMTADELTAHRAKLRSLTLPEERAAYRAEHHAQMMERAKERGVELPPQGCPKGPGMGRGGPGGGGMGPGGGGPGGGGMGTGGGGPGPGAGPGPGPGAPRQP